MHLPVAPEVAETDSAGTAQSPPAPLPVFARFRKSAGLTCELREDGGTRERGPLYTEF